MRETLINNFLRISKFPRESGHEEKIADFFVNVAKANNLYYFKDKNNNVLIKKKGNINSKPIALQAHLDMVCVKSKDSNHDFENNGIEVIIDGDKVTAKNTSLGADQGVGLSMMLTIMEDNSLKHPDLEFLFTTEEETTFNGAVNFPYSQVESQRLINLDNSKDNSIFIGADGDICNEYIYNGKLIENNLPSYKILIDNFPGGNSGEDVNLSENNALTTMARLLKRKDLFIKSIDGGTSENDLATFCEVIINTNINVDDIFKELNAKIEKVDNKLSFSCEDTKNILNEILDLKCGYITKNKASANLGLIKTTNNTVTIYYVLRSMDENELEIINNKSKNFNNNFAVSEVYSDSIWKVDYESKLLKQYKNLYFKEYNEYPIEEIGHGGIECSSIKKRMDGLDIISIGSIIKKYHTIAEVTFVSSWTKIYNILIKLLKTI